MTINSFRPQTRAVATPPPSKLAAFKDSRGYDTFVAAEKGLSLSVTPALAAGVTAAATGNMLTNTATASLGAVGRTVALGALVGTAVNAALIATYMRNNHEENKLGDIAVCSAITGGLCGAAGALAGWGSGTALVGGLLGCFGAGMGAFQDIMR